MHRSFYDNLANGSMSGELPDESSCQRILSDERIELLPLLNAAFEVRKASWGQEVTVHIINNAQNGRFGISRSGFPVNPA